MLGSAGSTTRRTDPIVLRGWTLGLSVGLIALAMPVVAGCGGGDDDDDDDDDGGGGGSTPTATATAAGAAPPGGTTVTGPNGDETVTLPPGSDISGGSISIMKLSPDQWPAELSAVDTQLVVEFGPDGAQFEDPVTVTMRLDAAQVSDPSTVFLIIQNADGSWESLDDVTAMVDGDSVIVTGTTTHFTTGAGGDNDDAPGG